MISIAECGFRIADYSIAECGFRIADWEIVDYLSADWGLWNLQLLGTGFVSDVEGSRLSRDCIVFCVFHQRCVKFRIKHERYNQKRQEENSGP